MVPLCPYPSIQERSPCTDHKPSLACGCAKADSSAPSGAAALSKHKWRDAPPPSGCHDQDRYLSPPHPRMFRGSQWDRAKVDVLTQTHRNVQAACLSCFSACIGCTRWPRKFLHLLFMNTTLVISEDDNGDDDDEAWMRTGSCSRSPHKKHTHTLMRESGNERLIFPVTLLLCTSNPLVIPALRTKNLRISEAGQSRKQHQVRCPKFQRKHCGLEDGAKFMAAAVAVVVVLIDGALQIEFSAEGCCWHGLTDWSASCSFRFWAALQLRLHYLTSWNHLQPIDHYALAGSFLSFKNK